MMKVLTLPLVLLATAGSGCAMSRTKAVGNPLSFQPHAINFDTVDLKASADLKPQVTGESSSTVVLGIGREASIGEAIRDALSKSPGSSVLLTPIVEETSGNVLLVAWKKITVTGIPVEFKKAGP